MRMISMDRIQQFNSELAVLWAHRCVEKGMQEDNLLILASMSKIDSGWEVQKYLKYSIEKMGLSFIEDIDEAYNCYVQSFVIELHQGSDLYSNLSILNDIYWARYDKRSNNLYLFFELYNAIDSWLNDADNKYCYWESFNLDNAEQIVKEEASKWLNEYAKDYFVDLEERYKSLLLNLK